MSGTSLMNTLSPEELNVQPGGIYVSQIAGMVTGPGQSGFSTPAVTSRMKSEGQGRG